MNARERFAAVMHYEPRDRSPIMDFGFRDETLPIWQEQGYPAGADPDLFFGMDPQWITCGCILGLYPAFPELLLKQIQHFFEHYKDLEPGKWVKVTGWEGIDAAKQEVLSGMNAYQTAHKKG